MFYQEIFGVTSQSREANRYDRSSPGGKGRAVNRHRAKIGRWMLEMAGSGAPLM
jgi:hypothetical protein